MSAERALLDTNVLIYALDPVWPNHTTSRSLVERARRAGSGLCVASQVLAEFYAVTTTPKRVHVPRRPSEVLAFLREMLTWPGLTCLPTPPDIESRWIDLAARRPMSGSRVFDIILAATMIAHGVRIIYTYNDAHFSGIEEIQALQPPIDDAFASLPAEDEPEGGTGNGGAAGS